MIKIDLHTHSLSSPDGGTSPKQYTQILQNGILNFIAITDHNSIEFAQQLQNELGEAIIVGEEINTAEGEIIGLFLTERIPRDLSALKTAQIIKAQNGLVYIPHPFETVRKGMTKPALEQIINYVDIIEVFNGRAVFQNKGPMATDIAQANNIPGAASSDAHGVKALGSSYTLIAKKPTAKNLVSQLADAKLVTGRPPLTTLFYPKANRLKKGLRRG